jgi:hypothetical protein
MRERRDADNTSAPWVAYALEAAARARVPAPLDLAAATGHARTFVARIVDPQALAVTGVWPDAQLTAAAAVSALEPGTAEAAVVRPPFDVLLACLLDPSRREPSRIFFATIDLEQRGGLEWSRWREHLVRELPKAQRDDGAWPAEYTWDPIGRAGGDVYETALAVLSLSES